MKYVIFDIDGTLTDTAEVDDRCYISAFKAVFSKDISGYNWESITHVTDWGITEDIFLNEFKRLPTSREMQHLQDNFVELLIKEKDKQISSFREIEGATSFINQLMDRQDYKIGIATGGWKRSARLKLDSIGIEIDKIPFSNSDHFKSRESIVNHVIEQMIPRHHTYEDKVIYFGDGTWDYHTCKKMGVNFIGIDSKGDGKLSTLGVKDVFSNFTDVDNILVAMSL